jgi:hypothetical protein
MTYRQLRDYLASLLETSILLDDDVTVCINNDEYFQCGDLGNANDGVLDDGHIFINVNTSGFGD